MTSEPMAAFRFGDVVLVRFPFTSQTASKQRPAVIVSSEHYNLARPDAVLMAITSQFGGALSADDVPVAEWQAAGLLKPSAIKPVFATIEQALVVRRLGALHLTDIDGLRTAIASLIG